MALLTAEFCAYDHDSPAYMQEQKFVDNSRNTLAVSTEFPASVSANSVLTVSRAMKLGPGVVSSRVWVRIPVMTLNL